MNRVLDIIILVVAVLVSAIIGVICLLCVDSWLSADIVKQRGSGNFIMLFAVGLPILLAKTINRPWFRFTPRPKTKKTTAVCSLCKCPAPKVQLPKTFRQFLWGGWTCSNCEAKLNRFGNPED
ncbi:MAG: hypothetical protein LBW77_04585 [Verrucomicrobiota bacterium]|jgi:hypothetical protein|nr:hypothetical protein [Verrucomicrobiota bacterium]